MICGRILCWAALCACGSIALAQTEPAATAPPAAAAMPPAAAPLSEAQVLVTCGACGKEVAVTAANGQKCPHCGVIWDEPIEFPKAPLPVQATSLTNAAGGGLPPVAQNMPVPAQEGSAPVEQPLGPPPVPDNSVPQEMNMANLPLWMKATLFFGASAACYYVLFYRR